MNQPNPEHWYALRVSYSRELKLKDFLDAHDLETFIPMQYKRVEKDGQQKRIRVPAVHNLVFVRAAYDQLCALRENPVRNLPFFILRDRATQKPLIIPDRQMHNFMLVAGAEEESLLYFSPDGIPFQKGRRVRVLSGPFAGAVGVMVRLRRDRRVVVEIPGVMAVATTFIHPSFLSFCSDSVDSGSAAE